MSDLSINKTWTQILYERQLNLCGGGLPSWRR